MTAGTNASVDAILEEGKELYLKGELQGALEAYERAVAADPRHARAHYNLGVVCEALGDADRAADQYRQAVEIQPDLSMALVNWGKILVAQDNLLDARDCFVDAIAADPSDVHAQKNLLALGMVFEKRGDLRSALECFEFLVAAQPDHALGNYNLGAVLQKAGMREEAVIHYRHAISVLPDFTHALNNLATILFSEGELLEASKLYERVLALDSSHLEAMSNLATAALDLGDAEKAKRLYERALRAAPGMAVALRNLSLISLREHDFASAWNNFEYRLEKDSVTPPVALPKARREDFSGGRRLAIWKEQGIGDQILFSTVLPELRTVDVDAVVEVDARLVAAYRRSLEGMRFVTPEEAATGFASCERQLPLGSLPGFFRPDLGSFARQPARLLAVDAGRARTIDAKLPRGQRIAISWRSRQPAERKHVQIRKSVPLELFSVLAGAGTRLVDVQYGECSEERIAFDARHRGLRVEVPGLDRFDDLEGVMATLAVCDLVVTPSNVTAHLAGAIGKRTWLLYLGANTPFYYWAAGADGRSLWYPSVEIMTDESWTTWEQVFDAVAQRLMRER